MVIAARSDYFLKAFVNVADPDPRDLAAPQLSGRARALELLMLAAHPAEKRSKGMIGASSKTMTSPRSGLGTHLAQARRSRSA